MKWLALVGLVGLGCADDRGPRLASVMPAAAPRGAMVTLAGERLCGERGDCATAAGEVLIGLDNPATQAPIVEYTDTSAKVVVPNLVALGKTQLVVTVNERASNALDFEVLP